MNGSVNSGYSHRQMNLILVYILLLTGVFMSISSSLNTFIGPSTLFNKFLPHSIAPTIGERPRGRGGEPYY